MHPTGKGKDAGFRIIICNFANILVRIQPHAPAEGVMATQPKRHLDDRDVLFHVPIFIIHLSSMNTTSAFLFDLDGVIIDSETQYTEFWTLVGQRDFPDNPDFAVHIKGSTLVQIFDRYYAHDEARRKRVGDELNAFEGQMSYPLIPGALAFVDALMQEGWQTAVVTSSNHEKMAHLCRSHPHLYEHFTRVFTAEDAARSKPFPDCYVGAARHLGFFPAECYVVEDSLNGVKAAQASGAHVIGITTSLPEATLTPYCERVVNNYDELFESFHLRASH